MHLDLKSVTILVVRTISLTMGKSMDNARTHSTDSLSEVTSAQTVALYDASSSMQLREGQGPWMRGVTPMKDWCLVPSGTLPYACWSAASNFSVSLRSLEGSEIDASCSDRGQMDHQTNQHE